MKANAAAFGGDPGDVTAFGESAGGGSVCEHLVSPQSAGLFQRAILESGPCDALSTKANAHTQGQSLASTVGCPTSGATMLSCLRQKTSEELLTALKLSKDLIGTDGATWLPVLDGDELPDLPGKLIASGSFSHVPTLLGTNTDEGSLFLYLGSITIADDAALQVFAESLYPGEGAADRCGVSELEGCGGSAQKARDGRPSPTEVSALPDEAHRTRSREGGRADLPLSLRTRARGRASPRPRKFPLVGDPLRVRESLAAHSGGASTERRTRRLASTMMGYWGRFASASDPNGGSAMMWPKYDPQVDANIVLDTTVTTETGREKAQCDFWDGIQPL